MLLLYIPQFGLTPDKIGLVFLANAIPYAVLAPISGALADKIVSLNLFILHTFYDTFECNDSES